MLDAARAAGAEKGVDGPAVTLSRSVITPFLQHSTRRDLRQKAYEAYTARGANGGDTDNRAIAAETLKLREERARLLGYDSFAAFKLETEMAGTPDRVRELLMQVWEPARDAANKDAARMTESCTPMAIMAIWSRGIGTFTRSAAVRPNMIWTRPRSSRSCSSTG